MVQTIESLCGGNMAPVNRAGIVWAVNNIGALMDRVEAAESERDEWKTARDWAQTSSDENARAGVLWRRRAEKAEAEVKRLKKEKAWETHRANSIGSGFCSGCAYCD